MAATLQVLAALSLSDKEFHEQMCTEDPKKAPPGEDQAVVVVVFFVVVVVVVLSLLSLFFAAFYTKYVQDVQRVIENNAALEFEAIWRANEQVACFSLSARATTIQRSFFRVSVIARC